VSTGLADPGSRGLPLIGITSSELRSRDQIEPRPHSEPAQTELALGLTYPHAILAAGGLPVILAPVEESAIAALLEHLDALVISGGPDLHPSAYGHTAHEQLGPTVPEIDAFELRLCTAARTQGVPLLGICRGLQVINVAAGGTLHQHLPDVVGDRIDHRQRDSGHHRTHAVQLEAGSRLATLLGGEALRVNSFHHQAIDTLGTGLIVVARAADGVVEGVEAAGEEWLVGVQWHAESLTGHARHPALFQALVSAALVHHEARADCVDGRPCASVGTAAG
jgi:putative glutamine amidotransferase